MSSGGSTPGFGSGGFNFGTGAFPAIVATPLTAATGGKGSKAGGDGEGGAEEGGEGGEEGEGVQLFGNAVIKPVVSLPEQEARTGEEEEKVLFTGVRMLLMTFSPRSCMVPTPAHWAWGQSSHHRVGQAGIEWLLAGIDTQELGPRKPWGVLLLKVKYMLPPAHTHAIKKHRRL